MKHRSRIDLRRGGRPFANEPTSRHVAPTIPQGYASLFAQALTLHQAGRLAEAEPLYHQVLQAEPRHFDSLHLLGVVHYQKGEYREAVRRIDAALKINPNAVAAHNNRGSALKDLGQVAEALASYDRAIALKPDYAEALYNRGNVLRELARFGDAVESYERAVAIRPNYPEAFNNRGSALKALQRYDEALANYERAIALKADYAAAWHNRANTLLALRRLDEALESCDKAIALKPDLAEAFNNRGNVLEELRRFAEAVESYDRALVLAPDYADAFNNRGNALKELKQFDAAIASYDRAIALRPDHADAFFNRGIAFAELERNDEAIASYDRAIALDPNHARAYYDRGTALIGLKRLDDAVASYGRAVELDPDIEYLKGLYLHAKMHVADWTRFDEDCSQLRAGVGDGRTVCYPFHLLAWCASPAVQNACARIYVADRFPPFPVPVWRGERYAHRRIRVAYLSSDFRDHAVMVLAAGLFEHHDRTRFETTAVSFGLDKPSRMRERLRAPFDRFVDAHHMSDQDVARLLRELEIDIAVDLNGFTDGARPNVFAQKFAPVQVNYLGFAGTLGREDYDYILADRFVVPEDNQAHYAEKVVYLPDSFMVNDAGRAISARAPSRAEAGLPERGLVFCCFNNGFKITPEVFTIWMRLLREIDGSVLWLSPANSNAPGNLRREAERRGIAADRLIFASRVPLNEDHLARLRHADLFLDTTPYNAHATACDALWAGVPVLTCSGPSFASRVAGSLLGAVGLPELITGSLEDYEALALKLARDPALLASLRQKLARNRDIYPLFETERFTRHIEAAYTVMWERAQRGEPSQSFAVAPITRAQT
jgi:predicted O-linked N-acetylglucosamine transferase (SPINDLY family)